MELITNLEQFTPFLIPIIIGFTGVLKTKNSSFNYIIPYAIGMLLLIIIALLTKEITISNAIINGLALWLTATASFDLSKKDEDLQPNES